MGMNPPETAEKLEFAHETGLTSNLKPRRYLWTDAFAMCISLCLYSIYGKSNKP